MTDSQSALKRLSVVENYCCIVGHSDSERTYTNYIEVEDETNEVQLKRAINDLGRRLMRSKKHSSCTMCSASMNLWLWTEPPFLAVYFKE